VISIDDALQILCGAVEPVGAEDVDLSRARGRVLAETVHADRDFPPTDRSAMDGFAVRSADLSDSGGELKVLGEVRAGQPAGLKVEPGTAVRIFTGAVLPPGADAVVMVERTREDREEGTVRIELRPPPGEHIRVRGQDLRGGDVILDPGAAVHAPEIAALASVGRTGLRVFRSPVIHLLSTGDEVVEPDRQPQPHQIRNSNAAMLLACLDEVGVTGRYLGNAPDHPEELAALVARGLSGDLLLITGGVSVGEYDLVRRSLEETGAETLFHGVAVKPGKPLLAARRGSCLVVGLPGNPVSVYVGFAVFVVPALRRMMGHTNWRNRSLSATLREPLRAKSGRVGFHLCRLEVVDGEISARRVTNTGSGDVLSLSGANGFLITGAEGGDHAAGTRLPAMLWTDFHLR
jgi:molybdopterin molybdotransferase